MDEFNSGSASNSADEWATVSEWATAKSAPRMQLRARRFSATGTVMDVDTVYEANSDLPGLALTRSVSETEAKRRILRGVVAKMAADARISVAARDTLDLFVEALPRDRQLPKVAPGGDGDLLMAWTPLGMGRTLVTLSDWGLYAVADAGSDNVRYLPDIAFDGVIPEAILSVIPRA